MPSLLRTLITCALSVGLGAWVGTWYKAEPLIAPTPPRTVEPVELAVVTPSTPPIFATPAAALEWAGQQITSGNGPAIQALFAGDPSLTDDQRQWVAEVLVKNYNRHDPRLIANIILNLPRNEKTNRLLVDLIARWSADDAEDVLFFMETLPPDRLDKYVLSNAGFGLARLPAGRLARFAGQLNDEGRAFLAEGLTLFSTQAGSWRNTSDSLSQMKAQTHEQAISTEWNMGATFATIAPQEVEALINAEASEEKRQQLLGGYAWVYGINDPERGVRLDSRIARPQMREEHLQRHVMEWLKTDREAALVWLKGTEARGIMGDVQRNAFLKMYTVQRP